MIDRVPTVMESHGKKSCHGKVMETEENKESWKLKNREKKSWNLLGLRL